MTTHYHVASGISGYGPDGADGYANLGTLAEAIEYARDELSAWIDMAHEEAHAVADSRDYEAAWTAILRMERLEVLQANLDPARKAAPLYKDDAAAYAALLDSQAAEFPHDVSYNARLYLWACSETECLENEDV